MAKSTAPVKVGKIQQRILLIRGVLIVGNPDRILLLSLSFRPSETIFYFLCSLN